jgi:hypothetical protein
MSALGQKQTFLQCTNPCPLYPRKRTFVSRKANSVKAETSNQSGAALGVLQGESTGISNVKSHKGVAFKSDVIDSPVGRMAVCLDSEGNSILCISSSRNEAPSTTVAR